MVELDALATTCLCAPARAKIGFRPPTRREVPGGARPEGNLQIIPQISKNVV